MGGLQLMKQIKLLLGLLVVVSLLGLGCSFGGNPASQNTSSTACTVNSNCSTGQICQNGACVAQNTGCTTNADCSSGQICQSGSCVNTSSSVPAAPTNLTATAVSFSEIDLTWQDNSNNETGFGIERKTGSGGSYTLITTVGANIISYADIGLLSGTTYYYRVYAYNTSGNSSYSNEINATTYVSGWLPTSINGAPVPRSLFAEQWTGTKMIVWGGSQSGPPWLNTGGIYDPGMDTWISTSTINAPSPRDAFASLWTGSKMIVWGGRQSGPPWLNTGGIYDPAADTWTPTSTTNAPSARYDTGSVWTGSKMIVWGGVDNSWNHVNTGGIYDPTTDTWSSTSTVNAPSGREAWGINWIWTGSKMIVWGGTVAGPGTNNFLNTGGIYDPSTDTWSSTTTAGAPSPRGGCVILWTGNKMIVWGGYDGTNYFNDGGMYDPDTDSWTSITTTNAPSPRDINSGVWTGSKMIVWGGCNATGCFNDGGVYDPSADTWIATTTLNAPSPRNTYAIWTGTQMIVWGGSAGTNYFNSGGRYTP